MFVLKDHWIDTTADGPKVPESIHLPSGQTCLIPSLLYFIYHIYQNVKYYKFRNTYNTEVSILYLHMVESAGDGFDFLFW